MIDKLKFVSWNCNGLNSARIVELQHFCYIEKIDVIAVNEAGVTSPKLVNYDTIECSKDLHVLVKKTLRINFEIVRNVHEKLCDVIIIRSQKNLICFSYCRDGSSDIGVKSLFNIINATKEHSDKVMILGDINAKSSFCLNHSLNTAGRFIDNILSNLEFSIVNESKYTFFRRNRRSSTLDLCIINSKCLADLIDCKTLQLFDSDHHPILVQLGSKGFSSMQHSSYKDLYPIRASNIRLVPKKFKKILQEEIETALPFNPNSPEEIWISLESSVIKAFSKCKLIKKGRTNKENKPWFNSDIKRLIDIRNHLKTSKAKADVQRAIRKAKHQMWISFITSIDDGQSQAEVWTKFQNSRGVPASLVTIGDSQMEADAIASKFEKFSIPEIPSNPNIQNFKAQFLDPIDLSEVTDSSINSEILVSEVVEAISQSSSNSSPGPDGIAYSVFKEFPDVAIDQLTCLYNKIFTTGVFPKSFKTVLQKALPKSTPGEFRPITLSNSVHKIFERIIYNRINSILDKFIPDYQYGFRKKRGSADQLLRFISSIQDAKNKKLHVGILFLDIKKAFDRVDRNLLLSLLYGKGIRGKCLRAIQNIVNVESIRVLLNQRISKEFTTKEGTPQGGILSPLLWNFYFSEVALSASKCNSNPQFFGFADDVAVVVFGSSKADVFKKLLPVYAIIRDWALVARIQFSDTKVKCMHISPNYHRPYTKEENSILWYKNLDGKVGPVEEVTEYKYLGATIDHKLTLSKWCKDIKCEVEKRISFIHRISSCGKLGRKQIETFYRGYVRGYLNYGCTIWSTGRKDDVESILVSDRKGMRMCCGALLRTPTVALNEESNIERYELSIERMSLLHFLRIHGLSELNLLKEQAWNTNNTCSSRLLSLWITKGLLQQEMEYSVMQKLIYKEICPKKRNNKNKYWTKSFWKEKVCSRIRLGVLPTKVWAYSMKLDASPLCRHCLNELETLDHLFESCPALDYSYLPIFGWENIQNVFLNNDSVCQYQDVGVILAWINHQKLFKK